MILLLEPFSTDFMVRALIGGLLCAALCAIVGTWAAIGGMAFLGEAMAHGMLPGVAVATLAGIPVVVGAAGSAVLMNMGVSLLARRGRLSHDTSIGLFFVGMLAGLGSFLRPFTFGHVRQMDAVASRFQGNLAGRAPLLGSPAASDFVLVDDDVDDTIIEVLGYSKQGSGYGY